MPDTETIAAYHAADLILINGADSAKCTTKVSLPRSRLVDSSRAFRDAYIRAAGTITHSHGPGGEHDHGGLAFTTWLDLSQATQQAEAIAQALIRKRPNARAQIECHLDSLSAGLLALDERMAEIVRTDPERPLLASHPVYQYFARRYGLNLRSVMWEPEELPNEGQWAELERILKDHPARWMLWEGEPAQAIAKRLRALGIDSLVLDPCGNRPAEGDLLTVMTDNATNLDRIFGHAGGAR
jgi:zinc transport system substrate-binding protein